MLSRASLVSKEREVEVASPKGKKGSTIAFLKRKLQSRICVVRSVGGIGDVLMITPALREIKRRFPKCHLTFAVDRHTTAGDHYYELVKNAPFIDAIIDARYVEHTRYDHTIDISAVCIPYERVGLPSINRIDLFAKHLGLTTIQDRVPFLSLTSQEIESARHNLGNLMADGGRLYMLSVGSMEGKRSWAQGENDKWPELVELIRSREPNAKFLLNDFMGRAKDLWNKSYVHVISTTSIRELAAYISLCNHFIGPDSGPMHMAGALRVSSTVLFGSIPPEARINYYDTHSSVRLDSLPCIGCWYKQCPYNVKCMRDLNPKSVIKEINR